MDLLALLTTAVWAGIMTIGLSILFSVPPRALMLSFVTGVTGVMVRSLAMAAGLSLVPSTVVAAAVVGIVALGFSRRQIFAPALALAALLPMGPAIETINIMIGMLQVLNTNDQATLVPLVTQMIVNAVTVVTVAGALGLGFIAPYLALRAKNAV